MPLNESVDPTPAFRVGSYLVYETIGEGAMGVVYRALETGVDREEALKQPSIAGGHAALERFVNEAKLEGSMHHPNIVVVYRYLELEGRPWIAMEYFKLGTVRNLVGHLTDAECAIILADVLRGLEHAHARGVVHRDLKLENLMRDEHGHVQIADFGIAKAIGDANVHSQTAPGWFLGDPRYVSPEVVQGLDATFSADLYAVGVIAYELLSGNLPFGDLPVSQIPYTKVHQSAPSLDDLRPDLDKDLTRWVMGLLHRDPVRRPASATAALIELESVAQRLWGTPWLRSSLPTEIGDETTQPEHVPRPESQLVGPEVVNRYASRGELLIHATTRRRNLIGLVLALIGVLVAFAVSGIIRPGWVIAGLLTIYGGLVATTYFDEREAFNTAHAAGPKST